MFAVETMHRVEVSENDITLRTERGSRQVNFFQKKFFNLFEHPGLSAGSPADHDTVSTGPSHYFIGFFRRINITICENRNVDGRLDLSNGSILSFAVVRTCPGSAMDGEGLDSCGFSQFSYPDTVSPQGIPAGPNFQGYGDVDGFNYGGENLFYELFILKQGRSREFSTDSLGGAAHVDIDDLCSHFCSRSRCHRHLAGLAAGDLNNTYSIGIVEIETAAELLRIPKTGVGCGHFRCCEAGPECQALLSKWRIRNTGHRSQQDGSR